MLNLLVSGLVALSAPDAISKKSEPDRPSKSILLQEPTWPLAVTENLRIKCDFSSFIVVRGAQRLAIYRNHSPIQILNSATGPNLAMLRFMRIIPRCDNSRRILIADIFGIDVGSNRRTFLSYRLEVSDNRARYTFAMENQEELFWKKNSL